MDVVGADQLKWQDEHVHTIDIWYSHRRRHWVVERLNHAGMLVGPAYCSATFEDAESCVAHWLQAHGEAHLVAARGPLAALTCSDVTGQDDASKTNAPTPQRRRRAA